MIPRKAGAGWHQARGLSLGSWELFGGQGSWDALSWQFPPSSRLSHGAEGTGTHTHTEARLPTSKPQTRVLSLAAKMT